MKNNLTAGLYKKCITPHINGPIAGGFNVPLAQEILDDLYVNALVVDDGKTEAAIVSIDTLGIPYKLYKAITESVKDLCDIPAENIILSATHNHTSIRLSEEGKDSYTEYVKESIISAIYMAKKRKQPVRLGVGKDKNYKYVFNRRLKRPNGSIVMNWINRDLLQDCDGSGVVDPELIVIKIENKDNKPIGFIVNYANHNNSVGGLRRSADISGYIGELLKRIYGNEVITVYLLGACGNVNWVNYRDYSQANDSKLYQRIATGLTGTILQIIAEMEYPEINEIRVTNKVLNIPERPYNDYDDKVDGTFGIPDEKAISYKYFIEHKKAGKDKELYMYDVDIHVAKIGEQIVIATNPAELFVEYGLKIKAKSPAKYTIVAEVTNGYVGYVPTLEAFKEGGYEVRKPANRLEKDAGNKIVRTTIELFEEVFNKA